MCPQRPIPKHRVNELMESLKHVHDAQEYRHRRAQCVLLRITKSIMAEQVSPITGYHPHQVCQRTKRRENCSIMDMSEGFQALKLFCVYRRILRP